MRRTLQDKLLSAHRESSGREPPQKELEKKDKCMENGVRIQDFSMTTLCVNKSVYDLISSSQKVWPSNPELMINGIFFFFHFEVSGTRGKQAACPRCPQVSVWHNQEPGCPPSGALVLNHTWGVG